GEFKQSAQQSPSAGRYEELVRARQRLETRCQIGGFANQYEFAVRTFTDKIADNDEPRRNTDPNRELLSDPCRKCRNPIDHLQGGSDRAFRIVFVRAWEAEIGEHTIAGKPRDMALVAPNGLGAATLEFV